MDTKAKGIVISTKDYKDNDKLALIFTDEFGLINAKFTGIKKAKAKLKAVGQAFCYADFCFDKKGSFLTVKTASIINSHINLLSNFVSMQAGFVVLETVEKLLPKEKSENEIFKLTVATLDELNSNDQGLEVLVRFLVYLCKLIGNPIITDSVIQGKPIYLDTYEGILTSIKNNENLVLIDKKVYNEIINCLNYTNSSDITKLKQSIKLLYRCLLIKFDLKLNSIDFL